MANEMDAMNLDERQRLHWLAANRATLMIVGLVWLGMIGYHVFNDHTPWFMIAMVPAFALIRFVAYTVYSRRA